MTFAAPYLLGCLALLPVIWWLLRLTPPAPRKVTFPALMLLRDLAPAQQTPARTPWWLLVLRLMIAVLLIFAFADPRMNAATPTAPKTLLIAIDNDWAAARAWDMRMDALRNILARAEHNDDQIYLFMLAPDGDSGTLQLMGPMAAKAATAEIAHIKPMPWPSDWVRAKEMIDQQKPKADEIYWLSGDTGNSDAKALYQSFHDKAPVHVLGDAATPIYALQPPHAENDDVYLSVMRAVTDKDAILSIAAHGHGGQILAHLPISFTAGAPQAKAKLDLPLDARNQIARFEIEGVTTAATTVLMDGSWEKRPVGLVGDKTELDQHSLLSNLFYIDRALKPYAEIHVGSIDELVKQDIATIILPDTELSEDQVSTLESWIKKGGVLLRFAGERLAATGRPEESTILPVALRGGDRAMGGALSWATPQHLQNFTPTSPFRGIDIPADVTISRQVLAEPSADLPSHVWASLADGTPLVTAKNIGQGASILFHIPAKSDWSNMPLSGLFVDMLRRVLDLAKGGITNRDNASFDTLPPFYLLDAFGDQAKATSAAQSFTPDDFTHPIAGPKHPPGLYGSEAISHAFNLGSFINQPEAWKDILTEDYEQKNTIVDLQPFLLTWAFALFLLDFMLSLFLRGLIILPRKFIVKATVLFICTICVAWPAYADDTNPVELTSRTTLAFVQTGDRQTDSISAAGLTSLAHILQRRTSLENVGVVGVDPNHDDLAFYPFLYWPIVAGEQPLTPDGARRVNNYLHHGGMILFDGMSGETPPPGLLQHVTANIDIPPLVKLPEDHVLKRTFYLLDSFPGRFDNQDFWLEPENLSNYDGVATVLLGSNGWAASWAMDDNGRPLFPCMPGGEPQREHALRFGINLTMYALTGNYKSDQMHVKALLDRMHK